MQEVLERFVNEVVPPIHERWLKQQAHTVRYNYPEQSLFWHATDAVLKALSLAAYLTEQTGIQLTVPDELVLCAALHDLDRTLGKREFDVMLGELAAARSELGLDGYAATLSNEDLLWVIRNHHFFKSKGHLEGVLGDHRLSALLHLTTLADGLAVIRNPREVMFPYGQRDRALAPLLDSFSSQRFEFGYHQLNTVTGFVSNLLHSVMVEFLREVMPDAQRDALQPLAFFPNGTVYVAPRGTFDCCLKAVPAEDFLVRLATAFYARFKLVLEKTGQFLAVEKGQPTPAPFAFLTAPESLMAAVTRRAQRDWNIIQWQRQRLAQIDIELQADGLPKRDRDKLKKEQKRLTDSLTGRVQKLTEQVEKLLEQRQDFVTRYGRPASDFDFAALKVLSDYFAFVCRAAEAYGVDGEVLNLLANETGVPSQEVKKLTVKRSGGVNFQAILLAYHLLQIPPSLLPDSPEEDDFLAAGDAAQREAASPVQRLQPIAEKVREWIAENVGVEQQVRALVERELLGVETLESFDPDTPLEKSLLDELAWILGEHFEVNGQQFPVERSEDKCFCNFCGRRCRGITLSAKMTLVDTPTSYSGYNMAESTDRRPRNACALCFFENVLRMVLFPKKGPLDKKHLNLFVFSEYSFTRHHAQIFHRQVRDRFPKALEQEDTEGSGEERDALLAAIQYVLKAQPEEADADAVLPVFVAPLSGDTSLESWVSRTKDLLELWDGLGLKYILTPDFYPEVEGIGNVRGAVELRGCHPMLETRLRRWMRALRPQPIRGLPDTALTISEAVAIHQLMQAVGDLAPDVRQENQFYSTPGLFGGAVLYKKNKEKAKRR